MEKKKIRLGRFFPQRVLISRVIRKTTLSVLALGLFSALVISPKSKTGDAYSANDQIAEHMASANLLGTGGAVPQFNFKEGDIEMLKVARVADSTQPGDDKFRDPITAQVGNRIIFQFYFHNGVPNTVAEMTSLRVDFRTDPDTLTDKIETKSWIWAKGVPAVSDTVVNGQVVGPSGATVNLSSAGRWEYVPGSTKLFDNQGKFVRALGDGITRDGVGIGDIQGCFQYAGFVTFMIDIRGQANLAIEKGVSARGEPYAGHTTAVPGEVVSYQITLHNIGNALANQVVLKDQLSPDQIYLPGSTVLVNAANPNGLPVPDLLFTPAGLPVPDMIPGPAGDTFIIYQVKVSETIPDGDWTLNNLARVYLCGVEQGNAQAAIRVFFASQPGLSISKFVFDGTNYVERIEAPLGSIVTYKIVLANTGNITLNNVNVWDILPQYTVYIPGSTRIDNMPVQDLLVTPSGFIFCLTQHETLMIDFQVRIVGCPSDGEIIQNTAYTRVDSLGTKQDSAFVKVRVPLPIDPIIQ